MKYRTRSILLSLFVLITSFAFAQAPAKVIVTMNGALSNKVYFELLINNKVSFDSLSLTNGTGTKEFVFEKPTSVKLFDHYSFNMVMDLQKQGKKVKFSQISPKKECKSKMIRMICFGVH